MLSTTLFTISRSWHESSWLFEQLAFASRGDSILLSQDGVLALQSDITLASFVAKCAGAGVALYALREDCELRGIESQYTAIQAIDYAGFVDLVCAHDKQLAW